MTSPSHLHTQARVQPINTYNHTYIRFCLDKTKQSHTKSRQTTCTLFTPDPEEYKSNLYLKINNTALPMATNPKVLGLTLDPKLTYNTHIHSISVQAHKPLQMIKALTETGWGKQKETLMPPPYGRLLHLRPAASHADNIKILRAHPPHINRSEEILPCLTRRTLAQLRKISITLSQIRFTESRRENTSITTTPPL